VVRTKNASNLTEGKRLDVRLEVAAAAGASTGKVTKAAKVRRMADPTVEQAVRAGQISIHKRGSGGAYHPNNRVENQGTHAV
jgi:hypothetical protein